MRLIGDVPIYVAPGLGRPPRAPGAVPRRRGGGHAAGRLHRQGPAVGQPALRLAGAAAPRLPLVDRAASAHVRALRRRADRPLPRLRRLLGGARAARATRSSGRWQRGPGRAPFDAARARARRAAADRRGPRRDHPGGRAPARRRSASRAWSSSSSASSPATRRTPHRPRNHAEDTGRLHRHARQRHRARLVRRRSTTAVRAEVDAAIDARRRARARAALVADPARLRLAGARGDGADAGRARARLRGAHEHARAASAGAWKWRLDRLPTAAPGAAAAGGDRGGGRRGPRLWRPMAAPAAPDEILDVNRRYHDVAARRLRRQVGHLVRRDRPPAGARQGRASCSASGPGRSRASLEIGAGTGYFSLNLMQDGVIGAATCTDISPGHARDARGQRARARARGRDRRVRRRRAAVRGRELRPRARPRRAAPPARPRPRVRRVLARAARPAGRCSSPASRRATATGSRPSPSAPRCALAPTVAAGDRARGPRPPATAATRRPRARGRWSTSTRSSPATSSARRARPASTACACGRGAAGELVRLVQPHARGHRRPGGHPVGLDPVRLPRLPAAAGGRPRARSSRACRRSSSTT